MKKDQSFVYKISYLKQVPLGICFRYKEKVSVREAPSIENVDETVWSNEKQSMIM